MSEVKIKDFYAEWCGPCDKQKPILDDVDAATGSHVTIEEIDVDEEQERANDYNVRSLPTIVVEVDGRVQERFIGVTQKDKILLEVPSVTEQ